VSVEATGVFREDQMPIAGPDALPNLVDTGSRRQLSRQAFVAENGDLRAGNAGGLQEFLAVSDLILDRSSILLVGRKARIYQYAQPLPFGGHDGNAQPGG
jgi:hypothetical protein